VGVGGGGGGGGGVGGGGGEGTSASYNTIAGKTIRADDGWVLFEGTYRYDNLSSGFVTIYVESSSNTTASFYIDDVQIEEVPAPVIVIEDIPSLKSVYADQFLIGNIASPSDLEGLRFELLTKHFNVITAENAMKPGSLQPNKGEFAFAGADKIVNAVIAAGMKMHGHTLAWHQQSPNWMNYDGISKEEAVENLTTHAKTVMDHFKGRVISWDVLNEAVIDNPPNPKDWRASLRQTPWLKAIGTEYIAILFRAAREADPTAQLYYNDYNLDNQNKALAVYTMVKELNEQNPDVAGRPLIDGIGMQGHYRVNTNPNNVGLSLERFSGLGVEISITELDVQAGNDAKLTEQQAITQGLAYAALFSAFKTYADKIARVTIWGLDDRSSWRSSASPVLFDKNLKAKPAFYAAEDPDGFTEQYKSAVVKETKQAKAVYGTPAIGGALDPLWNSAEELSINQYLMAWQGAAGTAKVLWDEQYLYVLAQVQNAELNKASPNAYEQDSVEVFIDENNGKTSYFEADDGQYRVNFANETSFNPRSLAEGFVSYTAVSEKAYIVIMKIPFRTVAPTPNMRIGFDAQINGASAQGIRQSVSIWNDTSGNSFQDTSGYGTLQLVK
jgi:endo-1,4-beta-xylanase